MMTSTDAVTRLRDIIDATQGRTHTARVRAFAASHRLSVTYVFDVLRGGRHLSDRFAAAIGLRRIVFYEVAAQCED